MVLLPLIFVCHFSLDSSFLFQKHEKLEVPSKQASTMPHALYDREGGAIGGGGEVGREDGCSECRERFFLIFLIGIWKGISK